MLSKIKFIAFLLCNILLFSQFSPAQEYYKNSIFMSSNNSIFGNRDYYLTIYDFGHNPAGIVEDQQENWMRAASWSNFQWGDFRREFDPQKRLQYNFCAEGVQSLENNAVIRGYIQYYTEDLVNVYRALDYEPYHDIFTVLDTTTGTFDYYGPKVGFEYGRRISPRIGCGVQIDYRLQNGLKREPSKTKIDGRLISAVFSSSFKLSKNTSVGVAFRPFSNQYRLNANKAFLIDYPVIYKLFGDSLVIKNEEVTNYCRLDQSNGYSYDIVVIFKGIPWLIFGTKGGFNLDREKKTEGKSEGRSNLDDYGSWYKSETWVESLCQFCPGDFPITLGLLLRWQKWDSWSRTPRHQTIFEEMNGHWTKFGLGLAYEKVTLPVGVNFEYYVTKFYEEKNNFFQNYGWHRRSETGLIQAGVKVKLIPGLNLRLSGVAGEIIPEYHLSLSPVKIEKISAGISFTVNKTSIELAGQYEMWKSISAIPRRHSFLFCIQTTQKSFSPTPRNLHNHNDF